MQKSLFICLRKLEISTSNSEQTKISSFYQIRFFLNLCSEFSKVVFAICIDKKIKEILTYIFEGYIVFKN